MPTNPHPPRSGGPRRGHGDRLSVEVALAAALLRQGYSYPRVVDITQLPPALIQFLAEHQPEVPQPDQPARPCVEPPTTDLARARSTAVTPGRLLVIAVVPVVMNVALGLFCLAAHRPLLAAATLIMTLPSLGIAILFCLACLRDHRDRRH